MTTATTASTNWGRQIMSHGTGLFRALNDNQNAGGLIATAATVRDSILDQPEGAEVWTRCEERALVLLVEVILDTADQPLDWSTAQAFTEHALARVDRWAVEQSAPTAAAGAQAAAVVLAILDTLKADA